MLLNPNDLQPLQEQLSCSPAQVETALAAATARRNVWSKTEEMLSDSRIAFENGDVDAAIELAEMLQIETDQYGFVAPRDPAVSAVETTREGIFVCGSAVGPQVIPDAVAQASAAGMMSASKP